MDQQQIEETGSEAKLDGDTKVAYFTRLLPVPMSTQERIERGDRQAYLLGEIEQKTVDMDAAKKSAKARIEELEAELSRIGMEVRNGKVEREVRCVTKFLFKINTVQEIRTDTGELLHERPMTLRERQPELPGVNGSGGDEDDVDADSDDEEELENEEAPSDDGPEPEPEPEPELNTDKNRRKRR